MVAEPHPAEGYPHKEEEPAFPAYWGELMWAMSRFQKSGYLCGKPDVPASSPTPGSPALFYPELTKRFVELIMPKLEIQRILTDFKIHIGASATFPKQKGEPTTATVGRTASGNAINRDFAPYGTVTVTPYRVGMRVRIGREVFEDGLITIVESAFRRAAQRTAKTIDSDVASLFDMTTKKRFSFWPFRYPDLFDVTTSIPKSKASGYAILMNDRVNPYYGFLELKDFHILRSSEISPKTAYVVQTGFDNCYTPIGYFVTKRPISIDVWPSPVFDSLDIVITAKYAPIITYPEAITRCRI
jgi:hypothetical protein